MVAPPIVLGMFLVSLSPSVKVVGNRTQGVEGIMLQFLVLCFRIKPRAACLRTNQNLVQAVILSWEKSVSKQWVRFKTLMFQKEPFKIPDAGQIIHTLDV